ncbi:MULTISPECIES: acyl-CoA dehydrogenase family protein [Sphingomonas]|uniref:Acyl-CoA dehydrogenase family protein n=1 Tax=Sphingomonas molluscorum TaxID=418184 RepID=A0ABU8Q1W4_9SPHN|nr:acyl-CoA dehydrogenase family protein [Sphingomonas sp. JUb134]MBM7405243.1 alkylation response protein AidB-like acyl-CoA dehydrogenase [Sphingomonas sp. JUb134]
MHREQEIQADLRPYLGDDQIAFRTSVDGFLSRHATPDYVRECDEHKRFPQQLVDGMAEQGYFAVTLPEEHGGVGGYLDMVAMLEVLGYHSVALARYWNMNVNMVGGALARFASDEIQRKTLPLLAQGKAFFAFALSENGSGSDAASLTTSARPDGDAYVINGTKMWITGALQADYFLVACRTDPDAKPHDGISLFLVPKDAGGITINPIDMLGGHAIRTCEVVFSDVRVAADMMVGPLHKGWRQLSTVLAKERVALGAICTGAAQAAYDLASGYAVDRHQFGRSITQFQAISHKLVDAKTLVDASRLLVLRAARLLADGEPCSAQASQAKTFASDAYVQIATNGLQVMGANGYCMEFAMQRHFRESKLFQIFGGTNEIQRNIVARDLFS